MFLRVEVAMYRLKGYRLMFAGLLLFLGVTGVFAESVDCRNYTESTDVHCKYNIIESAQGVQLYVLPADADLSDPDIMSKILLNEDFYVYAPLSGNDSVDYFLAADNSPVTNKQMVNSGETGKVTVGVGAIYPIYNVAIGTATREDMSDVAVTRIFNFYAPSIEYCLDADCKKVIDDKNIAETKMEVGDTLTIYVRAVIPDGPKAGETEEGLERTFYINSEGESKNLVFLDKSGDALPKRPLGYQLDFHEGRAIFKITSTKAITDGSTFEVDGYPDYTAEGDTNFIVEEVFPGGLRFDNHDMPKIDSAFVYDTNGDGVGDSIAVYFGGNMDYIDVQSFEYVWPEGEKFQEFGGNESHKGKTYSLSDAKMAASGDSAQGLIRSKVLSTNSGEKATVGPADLVDRIGPVVSTASVIKGAGSTDTLVVHFNKSLDSAWTSGKGLVVNGKSIPETAIVKNGDTWTFVLDSGLVFAGDSLKLATTCAKDACPDGLFKTYDGNETGKNNPVIVQNAGQVYVDDENNGFYDRDGDGRMDSASVAFDVPLVASDLANLDVLLYWLDSKGDVVEIPLLDLDSLVEAGVVTLYEDGKILGVNIDPDEYDVKKMLTSIDSDEYGYAKVINKVTVDGETEEKASRLAMNDRIPPQISGTFLSPESFQKMEADELVVTFSEKIDFENVADISEALMFSTNGTSWDDVDVSSAEWADDGKSVKLRLEVGTELDKRVNPADYIRFNEKYGAFKDASGNGVFKTPMTVMLQGDPRVLAKTTSLATKDYADLLSDKKDFTVRFVPADSSLDDEMKMSLGVLMNIGFSTIMTKDSAGGDVPNLGDIGLSWEMYVYTNLGAYVAHSSGDIYCDDPYFNPEGVKGKKTGNCLENQKKLYFRWNMRSAEGRKVGIGVYLAKFKVKVFGAKETFEYERYYNWGVKAGKNGLDLKSLDK